MKLLEKPTKIKRNGSSFKLTVSMDIMKVLGFKDKEEVKGNLYLEDGIIKFKPIKL